MLQNFDSSSLGDRNLAKVFCLPEVLCQVRRQPPVAHVDIINEIDPGPQEEWRLCFQFCRYIYDEGEPEEGYRFIWRRPNNHLQPARGQARIPSLRHAERLMRQARDQGWGNGQGPPGHQE